MPSSDNGADPNVAFRGQLRDRRAQPILVASALIVVAFIGVNLLFADRDAPETAVVVPRSATSVETASPVATRRPLPTPVVAAIDPGPYAIRWPGMQVHLTVPAGWSAAASGTAICRPDPDGRCPETNGPSLAVHDVTRVATDLCPIQGNLFAEGAFVAVGPTVDDLLTALSHQLGPDGSRFADVTLGGYPAKRLGLIGPTASHASCLGPEGRLIWFDGATSDGFGLLNRGAATVYVIDVDGERLVLTTGYRDASPEEIAQLDRIVASIVIERSSPTVPVPSPAREPTIIHGEGYVPTGTNRRIVDGVPITFDVLPDEARPFDWERFGDLYISNDTIRYQDAEAIILWTGLPDGDHAHACADLLDPGVGPTIADLAAAVATAPGIDVLEGPSDVKVGWHAAKHLVLRIREDVGCDPGYFVAWQQNTGGAFWAGTRPGDTISVWIVDVFGTRLFIEAATRPDAGSAVEREIEQIIDSIQFY